MKAPAWRHERSAHARGYGAAWQRLRLQVLKRDGYRCQCSDCKRSGRVRLAHAVDHIVPKAKGGTDELGNLQAINNECHRAKTIADAGGTVRPKVRIGIDGWPTHA